VTAVEIRRRKWQRVLERETQWALMLWGERDVAGDESWSTMETGRLRELAACLPGRCFEVARRADETQPAVVSLMRWYEELESAARAAGAIALLSGPVGVGKSIAAALWAIRFATPSFSAMATRRGGPMASDHFAWISAPAFIRLSRFNDTYEHVLATEDLVLDDLGSEYLDDKGLATAAMDELIDRRYSNAGATTIITTNVRAKDLAGRYGERVADRLRECATILPIVGPSLRRAEAS
jgi:DNA replication protein DnaC